MKETLEMEYEEYVFDTSKRKLQSNIIVDIISYTYGEAKQAEQISKFIDIHIVKAQYYLDYMVQEGMLEESNEDIVDGIITKTYKSIARDANTNIKISSEEQLVIQSKQFGIMVEKAVASMRANRVNSAQATGALLTEEKAKILLNKVAEIHKMIVVLEKESLESGEKVKHYNFVTAYHQQDG